MKNKKNKSLEKQLKIARLEAVNGFIKGVKFEYYALKSNRVEPEKILDAIIGMIINESILTGHILNREKYGIQVKTGGKR